MNRFKHAVISVVLVVALLFAVCTARPAPVYAISDETTTLIIILGGVIGGLMVVAVIMTLIVRNNPAWMPALPPRDAQVLAHPWDVPRTRFKFAWECGAGSGAMPLLCW